MLRSQTVDFLSFSYYQNQIVRHQEQDERIIKGLEPNPHLPKTKWGWAIDPIGLRMALKDVYARYQMPIFITENGIGLEEELNENGTVDDDERIDYLRRHIEQMKLAIEEGVEVIGYLMWGATDLLSSQGEMRKRYGVIFVNRDDENLRDLKRYKKKVFIGSSASFARTGKSCKKRRGSPRFLQTRKRESSLLEGWDESEPFSSYLNDSKKMASCHRHKEVNPCRRSR
ncbi:UNVERIFIED_ORG: glycosyl hydrolase family 1 [Anoxybacillus amylolyticus]